MKHIYFIIIFFLSLSVCAQSQQPQGENIINYNKIKFLRANPEYGKISIVGDFKKETAQFEIETVTQPKFIYNLASNIPLNKADYGSGRVFLFSFKAKTIKSSLETGEAKVLCLFKQSDSYKDNILTTISLSSEWQTYYVPFQSTKDITKEHLAIVLQYGFREQSFLIKDIKFEAFTAGTLLKNLPKTKITYAGMEADAEWRKQAEARIEVLRKGNFSLQLIKNGKPVAGKGINIKLKKHLFSFGAAIEAEDIVSDNQNYKNFKKAFDYVVLENDLKIKAWSRKWKKEQTLKAIAILKQDRIKIKGHVLVWPGFRYLTQEIIKNKNNPEKVTKLIENHIHDILEATKGDIPYWDVVNETYTNKALQDITGSEDILYNAFKIVKEQHPKIRRFTNEYGIISKGGIDTQKQEWYYNFIKRIDENTGGLVQGVGIQCHIGSDLTAPERVLEILAYYATLGKQIGISEFTMDIQDPEIREQYTRDFMIAAFSHPSVAEFLFWGCTEDERKKVDIFKPNGDIGVMGKVFFDLVHGKWKTNLSGKTDDNGMAGGRGFYGTYEYSFVENGKLVTGTFDLYPRRNNVFTIDLK